MSKISRTFATDTRRHLLDLAVKERVIFWWDSVLRRFVFGYLNLRNSKNTNQEHSRTDTTGMEFTSPLVCRGLTMSSRTLYGCIIFLRRECHSVCLFVGFSQDLSNGRAEQTSRFFVSICLSWHFWFVRAAISPTNQEACAGVQLRHRWVSIWWVKRCGGVLLFRQGMSPCFVSVFQI